MFVLYCTVKPPNRGHIDDNIVPAVVFFLKRLSFFWRFKCIRTTGNSVALDPLLFYCVGGSHIMSEVLLSVASVVYFSSVS